MDTQILITGLMLFVASFFLKKDTKKHIVYCIRAGGILGIGFSLYEMFFLNPQ